MVVLETKSWGTRRRGAPSVALPLARVSKNGLQGAAPVPPFPAVTVGRSPPLAPPKSWAWISDWQWTIDRPTDFGGPAARGEATDGDGDGKGFRGLSTSRRLLGKSSTVVRALMERNNAFSKGECNVMDCHPEKWAWEGSDT